MTRQISLLAFPEAQMLDVTGPLEVFATASRWLAARDPRAERAYQVELAAVRAGPFSTSSGIELVASRSCEQLLGGTEIDTLLVSGGIGARAELARGELVPWLRRLAPRARRVASICTGAFLLAEAGLLDGRRATTHWASCAELAERYPRVCVEPDAIFVRDGSRYSSAGVTAGMDLALALVEEDHGRKAALETARWMVMFLKRPGGQSQFSAELAAQLARREPLRELQHWILRHLDGDLRVERLARRVGMSPRNFARVFKRESGVTPAHFVELARLEAARRQLEDTPDGVDAVAAECGFGSSETLRRAFGRRVRVSPSDYRSRFRSARGGATQEVRP